MKVRTVLSVVIVVIAAIAMGGKPAPGELASPGKKTAPQEPYPDNMELIVHGSFMMGANTQSALFEQPDNPIMVSVSDFWMDKTEVTNAQYRQFVNWVRDSIARTLLVEAGKTEHAIVPKDGEVDEEDFVLNWRSKIPWNSQDEEDVDALAPLFYSDGKQMRTNKLHYRYQWYNYDQAILPRNRFNVATGAYPDGASVRVDTFWVEEETGIIHDSTLVRPLREPKDLITTRIICVYPDTLVWARDFQNSYNDPLVAEYFSHPSYADYPVVGVTWEQAHAFCHWRTHYERDNKPGIQIQDYRLPTEAEWEFAARGRRMMAMYPWGNDYARNAEGSPYANFKPYRGDYADGRSNTTSKVMSFPPNDYGLYDMAGNVAEWTSSSYSPTANSNVHDLNPVFSYMARKDDPDILKRKVVKGGSWKDISYFLQCGVRTYEYQYESRSYIGFRCVRSYIGE